ncbi:MAC/Perforin domain-containing protein [Pedobacter terrae]|uniref:MAC/Perforin domain-containing protein n=1 Tax=Pedobacter terrae TaxID=405671 RepID=A0A1G8BHL2_9SPHI|nr:MAC/perforin domain-containing protein [Pedobacter terrae]SDH32658.1 MAC/Perforin domain-containing protein [Pedobacter terrae]
MKNNYKLKAICLLCVITAAFGSCKKNGLAEEKGLIGNHKNLAIAGDGKWDLLGHGYDVTGELFERESASDVSIIDIDRFNIDYPGRIVTPTDSKGDYEVYYGANAYDYIKDVNNKRTFGGTGTGGDSKGDSLYGTANFSKTNENQNIYTYNGKYSYATYESWYRIKTIDFTGDATVDLLRNYLTPLFLANLANYSPEQLVDRYGTHVLLGIDIGGRLRYDYKGAIVKETTFDRKVRAIKAGFSIGIAKIFSVDLSADVNKEEKTTISNETTEKLFRGTFYGGNNSGTSFSGDALGNTSTNINLISWQQSINVNNASLIDINKSVPLDEFISDPVKKEQVKIAIKKHIADKQIKLAPQEIYEFYTPSLDKHAYNINSNMHLQYISDAWHPNGQPFKAYSTPYNNAVPIYQHYNGQLNDRILWADPNPGWGGYNQDGILFYAYTTNVTGTVPVYSFIKSRFQKLPFNRSVLVGRDHYYSSNNKPFNADWTNDGIAFYAFPN